MQCAKCHAGSCFAHLIWKSHLHSAEALLACGDKDVTGAALHAAHLASRTRYLSEIENLKREAPDYVPDLRVQLAYLATTFSTCRPVGANHKLWKSGHYDLKAWEIGLPHKRPIAKEMPVKAQKTISSRPASKDLKRFVLDYVLVPPAPRPAKRKNSEGDPALTRSQPPVGVRMDKDDAAPLRKKPKPTHPSRDPPGTPSSSSLKRPAAGPSQTKIIISVSDTSDSEEERPPKRPRVTSRTSKSVADLRFSKSTSQIAVSVADAFNTASVQNSKSIPNTVRQHHPSASAPVPTLPRRKAKQKAVPTSEVGPAASSQESSSPVPSRLEDRLAEITAQLSAIQAQDGRRRRAPETMSDFAEANERKSLNFKAKQKVVPVPRGPATSSSEGSNGSASPGVQDQLNEIMEKVSSLAVEMKEIRAHQGRGPGIISNSAQLVTAETTLNFVTDLVRGLVSSVLTPQFQQPQFQPPPVSPSNIGFSPRNWTTSYRGRSRGRGGSVSFGDHPHRSMPQRERDISDDRPARNYRPARPHYGYRNAPFPPAPARHAGPIHQERFFNRVWTEGPHAHERYEEPGRFHAYAEDDRREPQEPPRRHHFFPPNSPGNGLDLVLARPRSARPLPGRGFEGEETGSEGSRTVTNADDTSGSGQLFHRQTPAGRGESSGTADKFFRSLTGPSRSPTPVDAQDWETRYENVDKAA
ncbi:hypothetical protein B0H12DRAFT_669641 [Mycena haematopus]|nr:hypothetical protein B0H12DRAFT_669641 [Mycena haematopus]